MKKNKRDGLFISKSSFKTEQQKQIWVKAQRGIIIFCLLDFIIECFIIYGEYKINPSVNRSTYMIARVLINYLLSSWFIYGKISVGKFVKYPFMKSLMVTAISCCILILVSFIATIIFFGNYEN